MNDAPKSGRRGSPAIRAILAERFPASFKGRGLNKPPLKIGIHKDIRARSPDLAWREIHRGLRSYMAGPTYLGNLVEGVQRIDLDGNPAGVVTAAQAEQAAVQLSAIVARMNAAYQLREAGGQPMETPGG